MTNSKLQRTAFHLSLELYCKFHNHDSHKQLEILSNRENTHYTAWYIFSIYHDIFQANMKRNSLQSFNMSSFITGLDEAEAFGDIELMAEFSLLSVVQNLQQGKMATELLETLEVKHEFEFLSLTHSVAL